VPPPAPPVVVEARSADQEKPSDHG
jgi:hypothetical protein